jgi:Uncharacterized conserved protein
MAKGNYVDGFVIPIPKKNTHNTRKWHVKDVWPGRNLAPLITRSASLMMRKPPFVAFPFPKMAKTKPGEVVWFSFIVFKSKAHRNAVNKKVMAYFSKKYGAEMSKTMPFDMKRFAMGGFKVMVSA